MTMMAATTSGTYKHVSSAVLPATTLRPCSDDDEVGQRDVLPVSPNVRAFVANFEEQARQQLGQTARGRPAPSSKTVARTRQVRSPPQTAVTSDHHDVIPRGDCTAHSTPRPVEDRTKDCILAAEHAAQTASGDPSGPSVDDVDGCSTVTRGSDDAGYFSLPERRRLTERKNAVPTLPQRKSWNILMQGDDHDRLASIVSFDTSTDAAFNVSTTSECDDDAGQTSAARDKIEKPAEPCSTTPFHSTTKRDSDDITITSLTDVERQEEAEKFIELLTSSLGGSCDPSIRRVVTASAAYRTASDYVRPLFADHVTGRLCQWTWDCCMPVMTSSDVTDHVMLTDQIKEAMRLYVESERRRLGDCLRAIDDDYDTLHQLEARVGDLIKHETDARQADKYRRYVEESDKLIRLLLLLAGQLAKCDNTTQPVAPSGASQQTTDTANTAANRDKLAGKFADAAVLKTDIDRRGCAISSTLSYVLTADDLASYEQVIRDRIRLQLDRRDVEDWLRLTELLLSELSACSSV